MCDCRPQVAGQSKFILAAAFVADRERLHSHSHRDDGLSEPASTLVGSATALGRPLHSMFDRVDLIRGARQSPVAGVPRQQTRQGSLRSRKLFRPSSSSEVLPAQFPSLVPPAVAVRIHRHSVVSVAQCVHACTAYRNGIRHQTARQATRITTPTGSRLQRMVTRHAGAHKTSWQPAGTTPLPAKGRA